MFVMFMVVVLLLLCDAIMLVMERCCERLNKTEVHELPNVQRLRLVGWLVGGSPILLLMSKVSSQHSTTPPSFKEIE